MHLFVDTNTLLAFYEFTKEDLVELEKLTVLLTKKELSLYLPDQVRDEFERNREVRLASALRSLEDKGLGQRFPVICRDYDEFTRLETTRRDYGRAHSELVGVPYAETSRPRRCGPMRSQAISLIVRFV